jgi:hypothetical protein
MHEDISPSAYTAQVRRLSVPAIPNLFHWFRRYVVVDLAVIRREVRRINVPASQRAFFELCFASIIRAASNADPVPVSGLEVTSHMKQRDAEGRLINPFALFAHSAQRSIRDMETFSQSAKSGTQISVSRQDATRLRLTGRPIGAVVTSPPYHGAVDYYRRHQLEMYWLDLTVTHEERLELLDDYIGRPWPPARHPFVRDHEILQQRAAALEARIRRADPKRGNSFKHYCIAMTKVFGRLAPLLEPGAPAVLVVGHSSWNGDRLNTSDLFAELAHPNFRLREHLWYPVRNRYMSYSRHNDASIDREYVLVLERSNGS